MKTFSLPKGVQVADLTGIQEGFRRYPVESGITRFSLNVSAERISETFLRLASRLDPPMFLILEVPSPEDVEETLRADESSPFHTDVYYLNELTFERLRKLYSRFHHFFVEDGLLRFGVASLKARQEIFVGSFKIFDVFSDNPGPFEAVLFDEMKFSELSDFKTVHANFTREAPGELTRVEAHGQTLYDMIELLKEDGLYLKERREERP